jgi:M6 family metalloprotease-like protein
MNALSAAALGSPLRHTLAMLALGWLACAAAVTASAQGTHPAEQVRAYNAQVLKLQAELRRSAAGGPANGRATEVLAARAAALRTLMVSDPTAAEKLAFPATVLEQLNATFAAQAASLEQRGRWQGEFEFTIEDGADLKSHRSVYRLHRAGEVLEVLFAGGSPPGLQSGRKLALTGVRSGRQVVATEVELLDAAQDGTTSTSTGTATYPATCGAVGAQSVVTVLVNLPSYKLSSGMSQDFVRGVLLGNAHAGTAQASPDYSVDDFWQQNSDGKTFIDASNTTVVGPVTLDSDFNTDSSGTSYCDYNGLGSAAIKAVDGQVDFKRYSRVKVVMPGNGACTWAGVANVGCRSLSSPGDGTFAASLAWQKASSMGSRGSAVQLTTHEMGHNLGLSHASSRDFGAEALGAVGSAGTLSEYGDVHSTMGSWNFGFYAASHAANQLKWLGLGANYQVVESSGTYTLQNYEGRPAGVKALKVRRGTGNDAWLWIESRQNTGLYSSRLNSSLFTGALIHYQDATTGNKSHLIDMTPATSSFGDSALQVGQTWTDPYSNVNVTVTGVSPAALTVAVNYGALPCVKSAPTLTASPTATATEYGSSALFTVAVKNNSSSGCATETVNLSATVPTGWSKNLAASALAVAPGQTAQTTLTVGVPAPYALGTYPIVAAASAPSGSASSTESVTVIEPTHRLSLAVSGSGSVAFSTPAMTCTSSCVADYPTTTATVVTLTATAASKSAFAGWSGACSGTAATCTVTVSNDKSVTASFVRSSTGGSGGGKGGKPTK